MSIQALRPAQLQQQVQDQLASLGLAVKPQQAERLAKALARLSPVADIPVPEADRDVLAVLERCRHA